MNKWMQIWTNILGTVIELNEGQKRESYRE